MVRSSQMSMMAHRDQSRRCNVLVAIGGWSQGIDATLYLGRRDGVDAMERGYVRGFDAVAKAELWERWRRGESLKAIGRAFGKPSSSIYFQVAPHGGIRPAPRRRSRLALTLSEREEILRGTAGARSMRSIARLLGRAPSTVSREIKRNGGYDRYRAAAERMRGDVAVVRKAASWRTIGGYDGQ